MYLCMYGCRGGELGKYVSVCVGGGGAGGGMWLSEGVTCRDDI